MAGCLWVVSLKSQKSTINECFCSDFFSFTTFCCTLHRRIHRIISEQRVTASVSLTRWSASNCSYSTAELFGLSLNRFCVQCVLQEYYISRLPFRTSIKSSATLTLSPQTDTTVERCTHAITYFTFIGFNFSVWRHTTFKWLFHFSTQVFYTHIRFKTFSILFIFLFPLGNDLFRRWENKTDTHTNHSFVRYGDYDARKSKLPATVAWIVATERCINSPST